MALIVVTAVWLYPSAPPPAKVSTEVAAVHDIEILHFHLPGDPDSEQIAVSLDKVAEKYGEQILLTRVDVNADPERAKAEKVTKPPKVVMMVGEIRACRFQGVWSQAQIERKVEEILRGLKRMGKDWRPDVAGMQAAVNAPPAAAPVAAPGTPSPATAAAGNAKLPPGFTPAAQAPLGMMPKSAAPPVAKPNAKP
jgi:thioredoxin-like negative regulator of GroEL